MKWAFARSAKECRSGGNGSAMGNALDEGKEKADLVIGSNDEDGIAKYLESLFTE